MTIIADSTQLRARHILWVKEEVTVNLDYLSRGSQETAESRPAVWSDARPGSLQ